MRGIRKKSGTILQEGWNICAFLLFPLALFGGAPLLRGGRERSFSSGPTSEVPPWNGSVGLVVLAGNYLLLVAYRGGAFLFLYCSSRPRPD